MDMATTIDKLRELIHDIEQRLTCVEAKCQALLTKLDIIHEKKIIEDKENVVWKAKIDDFREEEEALDLDTHVFDTNNFKTSARKLIWGIGIPILILLITNLILMLVKGGFNGN